MAKNENATIKQLISGQATWSLLYTEREVTREISHQKNSIQTAMETDSSRLSPAHTVPSNTPKSPVLRALKRLCTGSDNKKGFTESAGGGADVSPTSLAAKRQQHRDQMAQERPEMTDEQFRLVLHSWGLLQIHLDQVGTEMFVRMFESYPEVKGAFGLFKKMSLEDVRLSKEVRAHGDRVLRTVGQVLNQKGDVNAMVNHLHNLGSKHVAFNVKVDYLDIIGQHFLFAIEPVLKAHWTPQVEQAWADFFRLMTHVMKEAMLM